MIDKRFFRNHQEKLVKFANSPIGRYAFRIHGKRSSVGNNKIEAILPNAVFWKKGDLWVGEYRTHNKFTKRLLHQFSPFWRLIHEWDTRVANVIYPKWNLGFDSFGPAYPDADAETDTCDGQTGRVGADEQWATIRGSAGTVSVDDQVGMAFGRIAAHAGDYWEVDKCIRPFIPIAKSVSISVRV